METSAQLTFHFNGSDPEAPALRQRTSNIGFDFIFKPPSYGSFYENYLVRNAPCMLSCGIADSWPATGSWSRGGAPYLDHLEKEYGDWDVPVADCSGKYFDSQPKSQRTLQEYVQYMKKDQRTDSLYLKDWHFHGEQRRRRPDRPPVYRTPVLMGSDWLNEYWEARPQRKDDYRFVYVGVADTWTPFHADVFRSFSWSANVCGRKRWLLLPPGEERKLRSFSRLPYDVASVLAAETDANAVSSANLSSKDGETARLCPLESPQGVQYFDVVQEAGEVMCVPSCWYHQVWNLRDTISINHNWFNAANVGAIADYLMKSLDDVKAELSDIADGSEEWLSQCQVLLKATHGMDVAEFCDMLCFTARRRLDALKVGAAVEGLDGWRYSREHVAFDLRAVKRVLQRLVEMEEMRRLKELEQWPGVIAQTLSDVDVMLS